MFINFDLIRSSSLSRIGTRERYPCTAIDKAKRDYRNYSTDSSYHSTDPHTSTELAFCETMRVYFVERGGGGGHHQA